MQKVYGARDDAIVRIGVGLNAVVSLAFAAGPPLLGMVARARFPGLVDHDLALPTLLMGSLPPLVGALGLATLFSAKVSSSDAILFMLSTSLSRDLYGRFIRPSASDRDMLRIARWAAIAGGALGTGLAIVSESIAGALGFFYTLLSVSLFVPVIAALYLRRFSSTEALASIGGGGSLAAVVQIGTTGHGVAGLTSAMWGLAAAVLGWIVVSALRARSAA